MCCLLAALLLIGPRGLGVIWWIADSLRWSAAFNGSFVIPLLGILFVPWTTITFVAVSIGGVTGFEWVLMGLALFLDLASYGGGYYGNARRGQPTAY
jgi:hypothetical protein